VDPIWSRDFQTRMRRKKWESWGKTRTWVVLEFCLTSIRKGDDDGWVNAGR